MALIHLRSLSGRGRLAVRGPDRKRFLHGMLSNDIKGLYPGEGCLALLLTVKAKLVADMTVYDCDAPDAEVLLEMEGAQRARVQDDLERHLISEDAQVVDRSTDLDELGLYAPVAEELNLLLKATLTTLPRLSEFSHARIPYGEDAVRVCATRELGLPGYRVFAAPPTLARLREDLLARGAQPLSEDDAEILRIEAGVPRYGVDVDEERLPIEANLDRAVSYTKGCYLGQEPIARLSARGHVNRRLQGLRLSLKQGAPLPERGAALHHGSRDSAGSITSAVRSPRHGAIALGYVHRTLWEPGTELTLPGGIIATVTPLPFGSEQAKGS